MTKTDGVVVVGVDSGVSSPADSDAAIALGVWEATRRRVGLHLVYGYETPAPWQVLPAATPFGDWTSIRASEVLDRIVKQTVAAHPGLTVTGATYGSSVASALVTASRTAALVIVTADSRIHYGGLLAGLTSIQVAAHAHASVIVVPASDPRPRPALVRHVVVGVDGSAGSADAVAFAFDEAQARGVAVHAIYVSEASVLSGFPATPGHRGDRDPLGADDRMLRHAIAGWPDKYPEVPVTHAVIHGDNPVRALHAGTDDGDLLVVGARGLGGFDTLALGSVSDGLVRYARRQVAIARSPDDR